MRERLVGTYGLSSYDAEVMTASKPVAAYFDAMVATLGAAHAKTAANWIMGDVAALVNERGGDWAAIPLDAASMATLVARVADGTLNHKQARTLFAELATADARHAAVDVDAAIASRGLRQISDAGALEAAVDAILAASPAQLADYRAGKEKLFGYFVGQAMKATEGKADPKQLNAILKAKLAG